MNLSSLESRPTPPWGQEAIRRSCVPLMYIERGATGKRGQRGKLDARSYKLCGGTALLWESRRAKFIVTAAHVWKEIKSHTQAHPGKCILCFFDGDNPVLILDAHAVSQDDELDIAVISVSGLERFSLNERHFFKQPNRPQLDVLDGDPIALFGHPGKSRDFARKSVGLGSVYLQGRAAVSKSGDKIRLPGNPEMKLMRSGLSPPPDLNYAGVSGAPVFAFRAWGPEWVGVVQEGGNAPHYDIQITPSKFINEDGSITRPANMLQNLVN